MSAWNSIRWPSYIITSVDKSKLSCYTPPPTQHHRFFSKLPPLWIKVSLVSSKMVWFTLNILSRECHYVLSCAIMGSFVVVSGYALPLLLVRKCLVFQILLAIDNNSHFTHNLTLINMGPVRSESQYSLLSVLTPVPLSLIFLLLFCFVEFYIFK